MLIFPVTADRSGLVRSAHRFFCDPGEILAARGRLALQGFGLVSALFTALNARALDCGALRFTAPDLLDMPCRELG